MAEHEDVKYPPGADRKLLESGHARSIEEQTQFRISICTSRPLLRVGS
jgi:hypothetical protein